MKRRSILDHVPRVLFPTCQVRALRFCVSCFAPPLLLLVLLVVGLLNCECWMAVFPAASSGMAVFPRQLTLGTFPAGLQPSAPDGSVPCQTSAGPQPRVSLGSVPRRTSTVSFGWQCSPADPNRESEDLPDKTPERVPEDLSRKECQKICQKHVRKYARKHAGRDARKNARRYAGNKVRKNVRSYARIQ